MTLTKRIAGGAVGLAVGTLLALAAPVSFAQTTTPSGGASSTVPGSPNTGAGGDMGSNLLVLGVSGLAAAAGAAYLVRKQARA